MRIQPLLPAILLLIALAAASTRADERDELVGEHVYLRGGLNNARLQFQRQQKGHVAFIGGSITEMNGYRPLVCRLLQRRFPDTEFIFTDAGIASTCSTTGAFRLRRDVLSKGPVDLLFIEFAVNDDQDAVHARRDCIRGMEGILRQTRAHNPEADVVITYFVNPGMLAMLQKGQTPISIAAHEAVARHYRVSTVHLAAHVAQQMKTGRLSWEQYGGTHPKPAGNAICAQLIERLFRAAWRDELSEPAVKTAHPLPSELLDPQSYVGGRLLDPAAALLGDGWKMEVPPWKLIAGRCRERFLDRPLLCGEASGAELTLNFTGSAIGAYLLAGPDAGTIAVSIDSRPAKQIDLYHRFSASLHYPRTVMFDAELSPGPHTLRLRISQKKHAASSGHAVRILDFVAN